MYATMSASLANHAARSARHGLSPRGAGSAHRRARSARRAPIAGVAIRLALSTIVMRAAHASMPRDMGVQTCGHSPPGRAPRCARESRCRPSVAPQDAYCIDSSVMSASVVRPREDAWRSVTWSRANSQGSLAGTEPEQPRLGGVSARCRILNARFRVRTARVPGSSARRAPSSPPAPRACCSCTSCSSATRRRRRSSLTSPSSSTAASPALTASEIPGTWTVAAHSVAGYRVREQLAFLQAPSDAVGRTSQITGSATITGSGTALAVSAANFTVNVQSLTSDQQMRDEPHPDARPRERTSSRRQPSCCRRR